MSVKDWEGVFISPITPYKSDGTLDKSALSGLIEFFINSGIQGILSLATAGRGPLMSVSERQTIAEQILKQSKGRVKVFVQTGALTTKETVQLTKHACANGADAVAVLPPIYIHLDPLAIELYYDTVANASSVPVFVYNNPWAQGSPISVEMLVNLYKKGIINGVVESSSQMSFIYGLLEHKDLITIIAGADFSLPGLLLGCPGVTTAIGNVNPEAYVEMYKACKENRIQDAVIIQKEISKLGIALRKPPFGALHQALAERGINSGYTRPPLRMPNEEEAKAIRKAMSDYKVSKLL